MRRIVFEDRYGKKHVSMVRDGDPDDAAPNGIILDPPDLERLDWEEIKRDLHNALVDAGLVTWADVQRKQGLRVAILRAVRKKLVYLYREVDKEAKNGDWKDRQ